ncbi:hypothetical protein P7C73_g6334, partial [Tremellales sp. Uapishka_1]
MSSNPSLPLPIAGLSKSAAKKRAKKAAKAQVNPLHSSAQAGEYEPELDAAPYPHLDPSFSSGQAVDFDFPSNPYYDDGTHHPTSLNPSPFSLPFPFDYSHSSFAQPNGHPLASLPSNVNITHDDLIHTANELYRRMADPEFGSDDTYWSSLPSHIRSFIRDAVGSNQPQSAASGQKALYAMAQNIVNAASQGMGLGPGVGANLLAGVNGRQYSQPPLAEEFGFHRHPDSKEEEYEDEEDFEIEDEQEYAHHPNGEVPKKKKNKKKKKAGNFEPPPPAPLPPAQAKQPPRLPVPPQPPIQQPALHPPPPPMAPIPAHPPP